MEDSLAAALPAGFFAPEAGLSGDLSRLDVKDLARLFTWALYNPNSTKLWRGRVQPGCHSSVVNLASLGYMTHCLEKKKKPPAIFTRL